MNFHFIFNSVFRLLVITTMAMVLSLGLGYCLSAGPEHNNAIALQGWIVSIGITLGSALLMLLAGLLTRKSRDTNGTKKEQVAASTIPWFICGIYAALPYIFCQPGLPLDKAIFEAVSGLTTTGATTITDLQEIPKTILLWRSMTQWLGGLGIIILSCLMLRGLGVAGRTMLLSAESSLISHDLKEGSLRSRTRHLWSLYILLTMLCGGGLLAFGLSPFQAITHAFTTTATAGFGTENDSFTGFGTAAKLWTMSFMLICSLSFPLYLVLMNRRKTRQQRLQELREHEETRWFLLIAATAVTVILIIRRLDPISESMIDTLFNVISIVTTTGYSAGDYNQWPLLGKEVLLLLMVIGGCGGSTSGGLKVWRVILWIRFLRSELTRAFRPRMIRRPTINKHQVDDGTFGQLFIVLTAASFFLATGSLAMRLFEPDISTVGCVSAVISSMFNIGPAFAEFGPTKNFANLSTPATLMLPVLMILGRLGFVFVLVLFSRKLWKHY
ncbi:MAG: potassium transporter TrkG [Verrucomicrobiales bacterium]